jgi:transcriptional regulator with XRE-family HTH domain
VADRVAGHGDAALAAATPRDSGRILRRHRRLAGWTQEELAHRAGLSVRAIRDFEAGRVRRPHGQTIRLLTEALDLTEASRRELQSMIRAARHVNGSAAAADGLGGPCQLPRDVADFTGRWETLAKVREHLTTARGGTPTSVPVCVIAGMAGVGKTTLAVHLAHQLRARFRDGQYFVDLHGTGASPLDDDDVLGRLLWPLGLHSVPGDVDQRACESLRAVLGIAVRLRRRHLGMTRNGSGTQRVALVTSRLPSAGVGLAPPLLA